MRASDRNRLINESNHAMNRMVVSIGIAIICLLIFFFNVTKLNDIQAIALIATISISLLLSVLLLFRYARLNGMMRDEETPPRQPIFETTTSQPTIGIHHHDDNVMQISKQHLTRRQWRTLARELAIVNWRWTRANVDRAKAFTSLTAPGNYRAITTDLERIGVVDKGIVTPKGRDIICEAAGLDVVI